MVKVKSSPAKKVGIIVTALTFVLLLSPACRAEAKEKVIVFHAGSLSVPFDKIEKDFEAMYPEIDVLRESGGSTKMARMISELHKPADIMASADFEVINKLLIPDYATWNILFATNQMVLCRTDKSKYADKIDAVNWYEILCDEDVSWGHSDPNLDPCGYRALMVLQLAEKHYKKPGLYKKLVSVRPEENVRKRAAELVSLLKAGKMDYAWEYLSVAVQHGLKYVILPDEINLRNYKYDDSYKQASVKVTGKKSGTWATKTGKSCTYGITMTKDCPNPEGAILFLGYLLDPGKGLKVLKDMGQPPFTPCRVDSEKTKDNLPPSLKKLVEVRD